MIFDGLRAAYVANRPQFYRDITLPFYGYNRPGAKISEGIREHWWLQGMMGGMKAGYDCIKAFSETDFTEDLKKFDVPTLILHGDDDQIVPIAAAGPRSPSTHTRLGAAPCPSAACGNGAAAPSR